MKKIWQAGASELAAVEGIGPQARGTDRRAVGIGRGETRINEKLEIVPRSSSPLTVRPSCKTGLGRVSVAWDNGRQARRIRKPWDRFERYRYRPISWAGGRQHSLGPFDEQWALRLIDAKWPAISPANPCDRFNQIRVSMRISVLYERSRVWSGRRYREIPICSDGRYYTGSTSQMP